MDEVKEIKKVHIPEEPPTIADELENSQLPDWEYPRKVDGKIYIGSGEDAILFA